MFIYFITLSALNYYCYYYNCPRCKCYPGLRKTLSHVRPNIFVWLPLLPLAYFFFFFLFFSTLRDIFNALIISPWNKCLTWARKQRPDISSLSPEATRAPKSQTVVSHTAGWRGWCDDSDVSPAPVPFLQLFLTTYISWRMNQVNQRALKWFSVLLRVEAVSRFLFPLIWLLVGG